MITFNIIPFHFIRNGKHLGIIMEVSLAKTLTNVHFALFESIEWKTWPALVNLLFDYFVS